MSLLSVGQSTSHAEGVGMESGHSAEVLGEHFARFSTEISPVPRLDQYRLGLGKTRQFATSLGEKTASSIFMARMK
jgi:hypothetical protein